MGCLWAGFSVNWCYRCVYQWLTPSLITNPPQAWEERFRDPQSRDFLFFFWLLFDEERAQIRLHFILIFHFNLNPCPLCVCDRPWLFLSSALRLSVLHWTYGVFILKPKKIWNKDYFENLNEATNFCWASENPFSCCQPGVSSLLSFFLLGWELPLLALLYFWGVIRVFPALGYPHIPSFGFIN